MRVRSEFLVDACVVLDDEVGGAVWSSGGVTLSGLLGECPAHKIEPMVEGFFVVDVAFDAVAEALGTEFFEGGVEVYRALVEIGVFGVAEPEDGEVGFFEAGGGLGVE